MRFNISKASYLILISEPKGNNQILNIRKTLSIILCTKGKRNKRTSTTYTFIVTYYFFLKHNTLLVNTVCIFHINPLYASIVFKIYILLLFSFDKYYHNANSAISWSMLGWVQLAYLIQIPLGTFTYYVVNCDLNNLVPSGHKELWRPVAANRGFCDLKIVVAYSHDQLWRPPVANIPSVTSWKWWRYMWTNPYVNSTIREHSHIT